MTGSKEGGITRRPSAFEAFNISPDDVDDTHDIDRFDFDFEMPTPGPKLKPEQVVAKVSEKLNAAPIVRTKDKVAFVLGVTNMNLTMLILGWNPTKFYVWHTFKALTLIPLRYWLYKLTLSHYFLWDFCYYANFLTLLYLYAMPTSVALFKVLFAFTCGPLLWAIPTFRNSLVFHSIDKMTSVFIHISPCLVVWCLRWWPLPDGVSICDGDCSDDWSVWSLVGYPMVLYMPWAVAYYIKIFVISADKIKAKGGMTLFSYLMDQKGPVYKICSKYPGSLQPLIYIGIHLMFTLVGITFSLLFWQSFMLHTIFIFLCGCVSAWNGANFYFEVFAKRYDTAVQKALMAAGIGKAPPNTPAVEDDCHPHLNTNGKTKSK